MTRVAVNVDALFFGHREVRPLVGEMRAEIVLSSWVTNADARDHPDSRARNGDPVAVVLPMINNRIAETEEGEGFADDPICTHESEDTVPTTTTSCGGEQVLTPGVTDAQSDQTSNHSSCKASGLERPGVSTG